MSTMRSHSILFISLVVVISVLAEQPFDNCSCRDNVLSCRRRYFDYNYYRYRTRRNGTQSVESPRTTQQQPDPNRTPYIDVKSMCPGATEVQIKSLNLRVFPDGLTENVTKIDIASNLLKELPSPTKLSRNIKYLDLSANQITSAGEELRSLATLEDLRLGWNRLRHLQFLPSPCGLRRLDVTVNFITSLEDSIGRCRQLESFRILANNVTALPDGVFAGLSQLRDLTLSDNPIEALSNGSFDGLSNLETLRLDTTSISNLEDRAFSSLRNLSQLILTSNFFRGLSEGCFEGLTQLSSLYLNNALRNVSQLPENVFSKLINLQELILDDNDLTSIPQNLFRGLTNLKALHLQNNRLEHIPAEAFRSLRNLKVLRLDRNEFSVLPSGLLAPLASLRELQAPYNALTALPELSGCCASLRSAAFFNNSLAAPSEASLRALLGDGAQPRHVDLQHNPLRASALRWVLRARDLDAFVRSGVCECGGLRKGQADVSFCVDAPCGRHTQFESWIKVVAAANEEQHG